ncbi:hypothetical protein [Glutamicibacter creatinolyticus]|uniref:hypothetical protein n=1 Tax=Glutamicibacter creatinolyticus TaxID=162496 RepID=UPI0037C047F4
MDSTQWMPVTREDREVVGYLEPVTEDFDTVQPRSVLGHAVGPACDFHAGEELLLERGIAELAASWRLRDAPPGLEGDLAILEVGGNGIVLADALRAKAVVAGARAVVQWPDTTGRLTRAQG